MEQIKTKSGIWFLDLRDNSNIPRALQGWVSPDGIMEWLEKDIQSAMIILPQISNSIKAHNIKIIESLSYVFSPINDKVL